MGREQEPPRARQIALNIKQSIYNNVGEALRCSIGMAPNRYLAKIASDMQKPDGLIGLLPSQLPRAIAHLELRDLPGVGARTEVRLNAKGITTMEQLLALDRTGMHELFDSVWGDRMYHWLRGAETGDDGAPVAPATSRNPSATPTSSPPSTAPPKAPGPSPTSSSTKPPCASAWSTSTPAPSPSPSATSSRANRPKPTPPTAKSSATSPASSNSGWGMEARFRDCQDTLTLLEILRSLWAQRPQGPEFNRPFFVGITLRNLIPEDEHQAELFADPDNRAQLSATMDKLNLKYGHTTLHFAGMLPARESAPTRIAFTQIPVQYGVDYM